MSTEKVKCLIIGSGPAGYTAAIIYIYKICGKGKKKN